MEQINEICTTNMVDPRIYNLVLEDIEKYNKEKQYNIEVFKKYISKNLFIQLERAIYKDFIKTFNLFDKFNSETIKLLKSSVIIDKNI